MNQSRLINKLLAVTLIISLTLGCNFLTRLGGTPDPNQEIINAAIQDSQSASMEGAIKVEQDMLNLLREQSGARTAFGDQADAIFLQIDQARAAALEELMNQAGGQSGDAPKVSPKKSLAGMFGTTRESQLYTRDSQWKSTFGILMMYQMSLMFPDSVGNSRDENGNAIPPKREGGDPEGAVGEHYTWQPKLIGSRLEATGTFKIILNEPFPYEESAEYTLSMELCPDAQGNVPLQLSFKSRVAQPGGGAQLGVESQVTGHVNDEATLDSRDDKSTFQGARQSIQGAGDNAGTANNYFEFQQDMTLSTNPDIPSTSDGDFTRQSSETDEKFEAESIKTLSFLKGFMTGLALQYAEGLWTKGYCVEVQVLELGAGTKTVQPNSETPFTAIVRHKFENVELQVPVIAKLADGQVSINPSGSKVPAPATFTYKAPDKEGQKATVNLETRSKRGVARLDVKFTTGETGWTGEGKIRVTEVVDGGEFIDGYEFLITFRANADGTIVGEGVLQKVEASARLPGDTQCIGLELSSLTFPPMKITGTVKPDATGQPDATFQLTIESPYSRTTTSQWVCESPEGSVTFALPHKGFILYNIEIAARDGAQANGEKRYEGMMGGTLVMTWELQIYKQATP